MAIRLEQEDGAPPVVRSTRDPTSETWLSAAIAELHPDPDRRAELTDQVRRSQVQLPEWLAELSSARVVKTVSISGEWLLDRFALELRLAGGDAVTVVVRIDHRRGTIVSDADLMDTDVFSLLRATTVVGDSFPPLYRPVAPADARACIEHALTVPRPPVGVGPTSEWQPLRPLLWWLVRRLPEGGKGYDSDTIEDLHADARSGSGDELDRTHRRPSNRRYHDRADPDGCEELELRLRYGMKTRTFGSQLLHEVTRLVGGADALSALDDLPLPDEPFDRTGVPEDVLPTVEQVLELCDRACDQLFDVEIRTATRRLLRRVATDGAAAFRRKSSVHTAAAALVWAVATRNSRIGQHTVRAKDLSESLAVSGTPSSRAAGLLRAAGLESTRDAPQFCAQYLTGVRRAEMIELRAMLRRQPVYRLRVTLDGFDPPIERTVEVLGDQTFGHLHDVLQVAFGWDDCHVAQFELDTRLVARTEDDPYARPHWSGRDYWDNTDEWDDDGHEDSWGDDSWGDHGRKDKEGNGRGRVDEREPMGPMNSLVLAPVLQSTGMLRYLYDLGDGWWHTITVESTTTLGDTNQVLPRLVSAARATPPDGLGGVAAYQRLLDSLGSGDELTARQLCEIVQSPVRPGTFDPYRPDVEQTKFDAIGSVMRGLAI